MKPPIGDPKLCRQWFEDLWLDVCLLRERYMLPVRTRWWENPLQVEVLAALAAWVQRYDSGEWDDPPGKLALLYDLERVAAMLRDGNDPFYPDRDRAEFKQFLAMLSGRHAPMQGESGQPSSEQDDPTQRDAGQHGPTPRDPRQDDPTQRDPQEE